jgi:hypothetical protein
MVRTRDDKHISGIGLELLALKIVVELGLTPKGFRVRPQEAGYAEADLIAEGAHLLFSRWMIQCKNTEAVTVNDLGKEIGMAILYRAQVVALITTGRFPKTVRRHAEQLAETTAMQAVLIDGVVLKSYEQRGAPALHEFFNANARSVMQLKQKQLLFGQVQAPTDESRP